jgi:hypothetical protein
VRSGLKRRSRRGLKAALATARAGSASVSGASSVTAAGAALVAAALVAAASGWVPRWSPQAAPTRNMIMKRGRM